MESRGVQPAGHVLSDFRTLSLLRAWRPAVFLRGRRRVGYLDERLSQDDFECLTGECSIGNVVADAFVDVSYPGYTSDYTLKLASGRTT